MIRHEVAHLGIGTLDTRLALLIKIGELNPFFLSLFFWENVNSLIRGDRGSRSADSNLVSFMEKLSVIRSFMYNLVL
jgi:hypothetical protein